ncbi:MAG TPA: hypothetical protein VN729_12955 [Ktedonobacteraceae bacterium]|nr:hypothetical protein [Ktedonobacteraceae bacterium]
MPEGATQPLSLHAHAWQSDSLIISDNGDDPGLSTQPILVRTAQQPAQGRTSTGNRREGLQPMAFSL